MMKKILYILLFVPLALFGQENYSFDFSYGNYGRIPTSETLSNFETFTMEFWYYHTGVNYDDENIVGTEFFSGSRYTMWSYVGKLWPSIHDANNGLGPADYFSNSLPNQYFANIWSHLAMSYDTQTFRFFINGELVYSEDGEIGIFGSISEDLVINRHTWGSGSSSSSRLTGQIDELRISNISRYSDDFIPPTQEFVPDEFTAGLWHFNNDFNDYSGNNNHGTHVGTSYSENTPILIIGCTDSLACNFDISATEDDSSCVYPSSSLTTIAECDSVVWNGTTYDSSGTYSYSSTSNNSSLYFDGNGDNIQLSNPISFGTNSFSVSIDCYLNAFEGTDSEPYSYIVGVPLSGGTNDHGFKIQTSSLANNGGFEVHINDAGTTNFNVITFNNTIQNNVILNKWYSLTMVVDRINNLFQFYVDGALVGTQPISSAFGDVDLGVPLSIGYMSLWNSSYLDGLADNLQIWNTALNQSEIQNYISCPPAGNESELVGYWNFEEGTDTTAYDLTSNGNNGTINGATYDTNVPSQSCALTNENGCDSTAILNLTINQANTSYTNISACDSYSWNDSTYTQTGTYSYSGINSNNYSLSFDGVIDYIDIPSNNSLDVNDAITISSWVKSNSLELSEIAGRMEASTTEGYRIALRNTGEIWASFGNYNSNENAIATNSYNINEWVYVTGVFKNNSYIKIYVNGILKDSVPTTRSFSAFNSNLSIGRVSLNYTPSPYVFYEHMNGNLSQIAQWDKELSQVEIQQYMNCSPTVNEEGLVGYWNFEEGDGTIVFDQTANGNNGIINGATYNTNVPDQTCALINENGCDSSAVLNLTINQADTSYTNISACDSVVWNGTTYSESGLYSYTGSSTNNNYSMSFDGSGDFIDCGNNSILDISSSMSIQAWIYADSFSSEAGIVSKMNSGPTTYDLISTVIEGNSKLRFLGQHTNTSLNTHSWIHLVSVFNATNQQVYFYLNGILSDSVATNFNTINIGNDNLFLGAHQPSNVSSWSWNGQLDDVGIWDYALSEIEIQQYMQYPPIGNELGLVGYWNFEEGSGNTAYDQTVNGNNGAINGATYNTNVPYQSYGLTNDSGCDSTAILNLTIDNSVFVIDSVTICDGGSISVGGSIYDSIGSYIDTLQTANGCDSIITTFVDVIDVNITQNDTTICLGDSISLGVSGTTNSNLQNGLVAYYPFNGNANDESGNGNDATPMNNFQYVSGLHDDAIYITGNNQGVSNAGGHVLLPSFDFNNYNEFTISMWVKEDTSLYIHGESYFFFGSDPNSVIHVSNTYYYDGLLTAKCKNSEENILITNNYQHNYVLYTMVYYDNTYEMYQDTTLLFTSNVVNSTIDNTFAALGRHWWDNGINTSTRFVGAFDDFRLYDRTLSIQEVQQLYTGVNTNISYLWSTGDTTASITVFPDSTTTYWVTQTQNGVSCTDSVTITVNPFGCTDNAAFNYDVNTICDNGSCYPIIYGCTSEWADNYITLTGDVNLDVNTQDESCYRYGCTYDWAVSFDSLATIDDGSCLPPAYGCTDTTALNFNPNANTEDGSCILVVEGCTDETAFNYNYLANTEDGSCEYICNVPSSWNFELSDVNHTLMIPEDISIQVNGVEIALGSTIGVFYTNDSGELSCAGYTSLTGEVTFIALMGDDSTTEAIDGLQAGEELVWMAWDINTCAQYVLSATYSSGSTIFTPNDLTFLESLNHYTCQSITLPGGWYMYSSYIQAEDMDAEVVLSSLEENLLILKDNDGNAYLPEWDFNGIGELDFRHGYQVKTNTVDTIEICGLQKYPEANPLFISQGWNLISYLRESPSPVDVVLEDMNSTGNLLLVKDFNGNPYLPEWNFNGIGDMQPGQGYQLKALELDTLFYLSNDLDYRVSTSRVINSKLKHFDRPLNTGNNMQIVIPENVWESTVEEGSEISAYNAVGKLVGATVYSNPTTVLTLWGNDVNTELVDGLLVNEPVALKVWNNERLRDFEITNWSIGANSYEIDAVNVVSSIDFSPDYALTSLFDAIPNPSYQTTNISFFIIESTKVNISVYTILGELMEVIANSKYTEGLHEIEMNVSHLEAGSYFYTMTTADFKQTNQLIILKE